MGDVINKNVLFFLFLKCFFIIIQKKKKNAINAEIHPSDFYTKFIN
jgi:hypothetical protein